MSDNSVKMVQVLEFEVLFPSEKPLMPEEYLKGGGKEIILKVASLFLSFKSYNSKYVDNDAFLQMFFGRENQEFAIEISKRIKNIERERNGKIMILNQFSTLTLFEDFFFNRRTSRNSKPRRI